MMTRLVVHTADELLAERTRLVHRLSQIDFMLGPQPRRYGVHTQATTRIEVVTDIASDGRNPA